MWQLLRYKEVDINDADGVCKRYKEADINDADGACKRIYRTDRRRDKMIRNIIFDIGNVLTDYRWEGFLADKGFDAEMIQKIAKASVMHPAWAEYDRGTWTDEQVLAAFVKDAPQLEQ